MSARIGTTDHAILFLCGVTVPRGYRLVANREYPGIAAGYARSFSLLLAQRCDVLLGAHGTYFGLEGKIARLSRDPASNPFIDPAGCRRSLLYFRDSYRKELDRQLLR